MGCPKLKKRREGGRGVYFGSGAVCWPPHLKKNQIFLLLFWTFQVISKLFFLKKCFCAVCWPTHPCVGHLPKYTRLASASSVPVTVAIIELDPWNLTTMEWNVPILRDPMVLKYYSSNTAVNTPTFAIFRFPGPHQK